MPSKTTYRECAFVGTIAVAYVYNKKLGLQQSLIQHHLLYHHVLTLCSKIFKHLVVSPRLVLSMFNTVNRCYCYTGIKFLFPQRHSGTERIRLSTVPTSALHHAHARTGTHTVNWEHSPGTAAQTNTLKIQTTHIQTLSLLNELALLRKDSATTLYHTLIPWGELAIGRDEQKKRSTVGYERERKRGGERRNQKAPGEREESRKRKVLHLAPHISKEDDRGDRKRGERSRSRGCLGWRCWWRRGSVLSLSANKRVSK